MLYLLLICRIWEGFGAGKVTNNTIIGTSVTVDVQYIGCEQLFIEKETNMDDTVLKEKRIYNDNLLIRVERYRKKKDGEGYELSISWDIEYQD